MKKVLITMLGAFALLPMMAGNNNVAPWGWATCSDEAGTAYMLNGGNFSDATTATLTALGDGKTDDSQIKQAIAKNDIIIFDGSKGDFTIGETMKISSTKNKTLIGINNARLCTKFFLTDEDNAYLKSQNLEGLSSTDQYTGTLPDGTTLTCDRRAFFTKKAIMELQYQKTGAYSLPNKSGIFHIETSSENIIIRNLSLIGPGAVDIDGADLITNQGKHVWIDHCTFVDSQDGALDSKVCDWATYTYNHFYYTSRSYSHAYTCGCGWVSNHEMVIHMTFACNIWGEGCMRRLPQADDCYIHLVNNYHNCPGNSVGMTINSYSKALVEGNYAAAGVNKPLDGSGANRNVTAKDNSFSASSVGEPVSVPYTYNKIAVADVPATLTGNEGAGATLGNDAAYILSTIPTVSRGETGTTYTISPATHDEGWNFGDISITVSGKDYSEGHVTSDFTGIKFSRNTDYTINLPAGITITSVEVTAYTNVDTGDLAYVSKLGANEFNTDSGTFPLRTGKTIETHEYTLSTPASGSMAIRFGNNQATAVIKLISMTTGISTVRKTQSADDTFYNLQGARVDNPTKGIYIQNGKKVVIK
jgi:pectate lyase